MSPPASGGCAEPGPGSTSTSFARLGLLQWLEGDAAWEVVDRIATKYIGRPCSRDEERVVLLIEPDRQSAG